MPPAIVRKIRLADTPLKTYSPPQLFKLDLSVEQLERIKTAPDKDAGLARVYLEVR